MIWREVGKFGKMDINRFLDSEQISYEFNLQRDYLDIIESHIAQVHEDRQKQLESNDSNFETANEYYSAQEDIWFTDLHGDRLRKSFLVNLMSWLEWWTAVQCEYFREKRGLSMSYKDLKGKGLERTKDYLSKHVKIDFSASPPGWDSIKKSWKLRNCVVHNNGLLEGLSDKEKKVIVGFVNSKSALNIKKAPTPWLSEETIFISQGFCEWLLNESEQFAFWLFFKG